MEWIKMPVHAPGHVLPVFLEVENDGNLHKSTQYWWPRSEVLHDLESVESEFSEN